MKTMPVHFLFKILSILPFYIIIGFGLFCTGEDNEVKDGTIKINSHVTPETGIAGKPLQFIIQIEMYGKLKYKKPSLPGTIQGFQFTGTSVNKQISYGPEGRMETSIYTYNLIPLKPGTFQLPAVTIEANEKIYKTDPIQIVIEEGNERNENFIHPGPPKSPGPSDDGTFI